jgi:regulatory protein
VSSPSALFPEGAPGVLASVREHPRKPGRYRVRLADRRDWLVDAEAVAALPALVAGTPLGTGHVIGLEAAHRSVATFDRALRILARSRRSRRELAQRLGRLEPDATVCARVLDRLASLGLLDDAAVARAEADARLRRGDGTGRVRQVLRRKGIEGRLVDQVLREAIADDAVDDAARCLAAAERRARALRSHPPEVQRRRLTAWLLRRGFGGSEVTRAVRATLGRAGIARD